MDEGSERVILGGDAVLPEVWDSVRGGRFRAECISDVYGLWLRLLSRPIACEWMPGSRGWAGPAGAARDRAPLWFVVHPLGLCRLRRDAGSGRGARDGG